MIFDGVIEPMELAHLRYRKGTFEDYVGKLALESRGKEKWQQHVFEMVSQLVASLAPDDIVLGGGNVKKLGELPPCCRAGANAHAFVGGFRLWEKDGVALP
jgi:polyphosphate glucokinase